ncbi:Tox-REase-5 domain-containing protein [Pyxidicoccus trucidator]|uniref:Tox-REase-5 domain-containing protein n=1 Tax=Pyxidicoccus trucidator TaxID=2709662 RepID=UPI0023DD8FDB|nr:Tox-REase-5 domain-containing protein [Pyxidicoccus trucidator]
MVVAMASPADLAVRAVTQGAVRLDAFEQLLVAAGLDSAELLPRRDALSPREAARVLALLMARPVTLSNFPPRQAVGHVLREVLEGGEVSREELLRRVERFSMVAVLRPDGYLAWTRSGRTQQRVGPVQWNDGSFRSGPFELGRFYSGKGGAFRVLDDGLRDAGGGVLAEVYDDADYVGRTLDGAEEAFVELVMAMGQLLTSPADSLAALRHLPSGLAALVASSPEYLERFRHMSRGEQVKALSKLTTNLIATWGAASGVTRTVTGALRGAEATVPVLSLSAEGALVMERVAVPVGQAATVLGGGPGAAIILQRARSGGGAQPPADGPGRWEPANESMSHASREYQAQVTGAPEGLAYKVRDVKFDGYRSGVLLETKGLGYAKFLKNGSFRSWFRGADGMLQQAERQLKAAMGTPIEWHFAERDVADAVRAMLHESELGDIKVVFTPVR